MVDIEDLKQVLGLLYYAYDDECGSDNNVWDCNIFQDLMGKYNITEEDILKSVSSIC